MLTFGAASTNHNFSPMIYTCFLVPAKIYVVFTTRSLWQIQVERHCTVSPSEIASSTIMYYRWKTYFSPGNSFPVPGNCWETGGKSGNFWQLAGNWETIKSKLICPNPAREGESKNRSEITYISPLVLHKAGLRNFCLYIAKIPIERTIIINRSFPVFPSNPHH